MSRADRETLIRKRKITSSDFTNDFELNYDTGDVAVVTNEESIKQRVRNLILTEKGEAFYDPDRGSEFRKSLFELYDPGQLEFVKLQVKSMLEVYEPQAALIDIIMSDEHGLMNNTLGATFRFGLKDRDEIFDISIVVQRVR